MFKKGKKTLAMLLALILTLSSFGSLAVSAVSTTTTEEVKPDMEIDAFALASEIRAGEGAIPQAPTAADQRQVLNFNTEWKFIDHNDAAARGIDYDESAAEDVALPHSREYYDLLKVTVDRENDLVGDIDPVNWYRRHFSIPETEKDKRVFVEFNGGGQINRVYVNGGFVGEAKGTFTHFKFDITDFITFGDYDNVIAVQTDNYFYTGTMPPGPNRGFMMFGGLHGNATMTIVDRSYIDSVYYYNDNDSDLIKVGCTEAPVHGEVVVKNTYAEEQTFTVESKIGDSVVTENVTLAPDAEAVVKVEHKIANPHLWDVNDPYLYTVETTLFCGDLELDQDSREIGIRSFTCDSPAEPEARFYLNGEQIDIIGTNKHEQAPYLGNAVTDKLQRRDAHVIKYDLGLNYIRTSHYQASPAFLDECDKIGLLVEEEALGLGDNTGSEAWNGQFTYSVLEMIKRDRNHASIVVWSVLSNERRPDAPSLPETIALHEKAKALDQSRLTIQEECNSSTLVADVFGYHDYTRPNSEPKDGNPLGLNKPTSVKSWFVTEWNNDTGRNFVVPADSELRKMKQLLNYTRNLERYYTEDNVMGVLQFALYGYMDQTGTQDSNGLKSDGQNSRNIRNVGVVGPMLDALNKQWFGYVYQSQDLYADMAPVLFICSEWKKDSLSLSGAKVEIADPREAEQNGEKAYIYPDAEPNSIYVASNCTDVELFYKDGDNKVSLGKLAEPNLNTGLRQGLYEFTVDPAKCPWTPTSMLIAEGVRDGKPVVSTVYASTMDIEDDAQLKLHYATEEFGTIEADGSDVAWIIAELQDKNGQREFYGDENVIAEIVGDNADIVAGYYADNGKDMEFGSTAIPMYDGLAGFYVRSRLDQTGTATAKVSVDVGQSIDCTDETAFKFGPTGWETVGKGGMYDVNQETYDAYNGSFYRSTGKGAYVDITFTGTQVALYSENENYTAGTSQEKFDMTVTGEEVPTENILLYIANGKSGIISNQRVYMSPVLPYGTHTIRVTAANNNPIVIDRIKVYDGKADLEETIDVEIKAMAATRVANGEGKELANEIAITRAELENLIASTESLVRDDYTAASWMNMVDSVARGQAVLDNENATEADIANATLDLAAKIESLVKVKQAAHYSVRIDHRKDKTSDPDLENRVYYWSTKGGTDVGTKWDSGIGWVCDNGTSATTYSARSHVKPGDYFQIKFTGSKIKLFSRMNNGNGWADIIIDEGTDAEQLFHVNLNRPGGGLTGDEAYFESPLLPYGQHTIKAVFASRDGLKPYENGEVVPNSAATIISLGFAEVYDEAASILIDQENAKSDILALLDTIETFDLALLDPTHTNVKNALKAEMETSHAMLRNEAATAEEIVAVRDALKEAVKNTVDAFREILGAAIAEAEAVDQEVYTPDSLAALAEVIAANKVVYEDVAASGAALCTAIHAVRDGMDALVSMMSKIGEIDHKDVTEDPNAPIEEGKVGHVSYWTHKTDVNNTGEAGYMTPVGPNVFNRSWQFGGVIGDDSGRSHTYTALPRTYGANHFTIKFTGRQIALYSHLKGDNGWAKVLIDEENDAFKPEEYSFSGYGKAKPTEADKAMLDKLLDLPGENINLWRPEVTTNYAQLMKYYESPVMEYGEHTITVIYLQKSGDLAVDDPANYPDQGGKNTNLSFSYAEVYDLRFDPVESIELNAETLEMYMGGGSKLTATILPATAFDKSLKWESSNPEIVTVDENGKLKALAEGKATITVTAMDSIGEKYLTDSCEVTVTSAPPIEVNGAANLTAGEALISGDTISIEPDFNKMMAVKNWNEGDIATWSIKVTKPGTYKAIFDYTKKVDSTATIATNKGDLKTITNWKANSEGKYNQANYVVNDLELTEDMTFLSVTAGNDDFMNLRAITLICTDEEASFELDGSTPGTGLNKMDPSNIVNNGGNPNNPQSIQLNGKTIGYWLRTESVYWPITVEKAGPYKVAFRYNKAGAPETSFADMQLRLDADLEILSEFTIQGSGDPNSFMYYVSEDTIELPAGEHVLDFYANESIKDGAATFVAEVNTLELIYVGDDVDKSALEDLYNDNLDRDKDDYTRTSWKDFEKAMENAEAVLNDENATQEDVDAAYADLIDAINGLKKDRPILFPGDGAGAGMPFDDVYIEDWFYDHVEYVYNNDIMNGTGKDLFSPYADLTRSMLVTTLYRLEGEPNVKSSGRFPDVAKDMWYTDAVEWAAKEKIVEGYNTGKFGPEDPVTREQLAVILYRYAQYKGEDVSYMDYLTDSAKVSNWAVKQVKWAVAYDLLVDGRSVDATVNANRAEVAKALHMFMEDVIR